MLDQLRHPAMHPNARYLSRAPRSKKAVKKDMRQGFIILLACLAFMTGLGWAVGKFTRPEPTAPAAAARYSVARWAGDTDND